jgi:hypothetical protein
MKTAGRAGPRTFDEADNFRDRALKFLAADELLPRELILKSPTSACESDAAGYRLSLLTFFFFSLQPALPQVSARTEPPSPGSLPLLQ